MDCNQLRPHAAIWPHIDIAAGPSLVVVVQAAEQGGILRIAREKVVNWREAIAGGLTFARRARDTVCLPMRDSGDVCCFDGCSYAHEVTCVYGRKPCVTVALTLACPKK